jgi:hypothetical protein
MAFFTHTDSAKNLHRFYVVQLSPTLFGDWTLLREMGPQRITRHCAHDQL